MGGPMARNLARAGCEVTVWNRTREKAEALTGEGVTVAEDPASAVADASHVVTMLIDGEAVDEVMFGQGGADALGDDALWLQMSTVGVEATDRFTGLAQERSLLFVDAPVLGTKQPAESGELVVLASGPEALRERCEVIFDAVGKKTLWLAEAGQSSRLKLVANAWILALLGGLAESIALAEQLGLDPRSFLEAIDGGPVGPPYADLKGSAMIDGEFPAAFPLHHALKDAELILSAAKGAQADRPLSPVLRDRLERAVQMGHGEDDMAAVIHAWSR